MTSMPNIIRIYPPGATRPERRVIDNRRKKIAKRGPMITDFTVLFDATTQGGYIRFKELEMLLPRGLYKVMMEAVEQKEGAAIIERDTEEAGLTMLDLNTMLNNAKRIAKEERHRNINSA